jgi:ferredoxin
MTIVVNQRRCIGSAMCTAVAPELFALDAAGLAEPLAERAEGELERALEEAIAVCPVAAIAAKRDA